MNIITKEILTLKQIFPRALEVMDSINSNHDNGYLLLFHLGIDDYDLAEAEAYGFIFKHACGHLTDDKRCAQLFVDFEKEPDCINCGQIERNHNAQKEGIFCQEEYQTDKNKSLVFIPETEKQRFAKYGVNYSPPLDRKYKK